MTLRWFRTFDPLLAIIPVVLTVVSVVFVYLLTQDTAGTATAWRAAAYGVAALVLMLGVAAADYRGLRAWAPWLFAAGILTTVAVYFVGSEVFGAKLWIDLGFFQFQPSEPLKFLLIVYLASLLSRAPRPLPWGTFWAALGAVLLATGVVFFQPDFGTSMILFAVGIGVLLHGVSGGLQRGVIAAGLLALAVVATLAIRGVAPLSEVLKPYQRDRLTSFVDAESDPQGSGWNVLQSKIAVGSGGLLGKGLGNGTQSQLNFLPVAHADFMYAGIAEAWGLMGSLLVIGLLTTLALRCVSIAKLAPDRFGQLVAIGAAVKITFELLVNAGMNLGVMPVTGIPLPFLSYGGTALLTNALIVGVVQSIAVRHQRAASS